MRKSVTVSLKVDRDLVEEFEKLLALNGHVKSTVFRDFMCQYTRYYTDDGYYKKMIQDMQFRNIKKG